MKQYLKPIKIVESCGVKNVKALLSNGLYKNKYSQIAYQEQNCLAITKTGGYLVLDYGKELCGGIKILTSLVYNEIRVRFGESLREVYSSIGKKNATNHHSPRDFEYLLVGLSSADIGQTGFRFVRIDFYPDVSTEDEDIALIKCIVAENNILRKTAIYKYEGNDEIVKKIFNAAKRTVDLCSSTGLIWDGIKRDRLVWVGDLYPEILSLSTMYGPCKVIEESLEFEKSRSKYQTYWMCSLNTYNAWWVICLCEYYFRTQGKVIDFVKKNVQYLEEQIELFLHFVDCDGNMRFSEETRFFVDWPCSDCVEDVNVGARFIYMLCAKYAVKLLKCLNMDSTKAQTLYDYLLKGDLSVKCKKQVIGLKFLVFGEISDDEYNKLIKDGAYGFSTFMSYPILSAIASKDRQKAVCLMKEYYGAMLEKGATTFWEDFDMEWIDGSGRIDKLPEKGQKDIHGDYGKYCYRGFRHSLCHAWSSGVNAFIKENCK